MIFVGRAADYKLSVLGPGAEIGGATVPGGQLGMLVGDEEDGGYLLLGTREELNGFIDLGRWHLVDIPASADGPDPGPQCASCPHVEAGHAGPDGMCMVMVAPPGSGQRKGESCPCVRFTPKEEVS